MFTAESYTPIPTEKLQQGVPKSQIILLLTALISQSLLFIFPVQKNHSISNRSVSIINSLITAMKQKQVEKIEKDYGQDLLHTVVFLVLLLVVLWYFKV